MARTREHLVLGDWAFLGFCKVVEATALLWNGPIYSRDFDLIGMFIWFFFTLDVSFAPRCSSFQHRKASHECYLR